MSEQLTLFFRLVSSFRRPGADALVKRVVVNDELPLLAEQTRSRLLKNRIYQFLRENAEKKPLPKRS